HTDALIHGLADRLGPNLTKFAFSGFSRSIGSDPFVSLLSVSPRLVSLAIDGGEGLDVDTIVIFAGRNCPMLKELSVYDISMVRLCCWQFPHSPHLPLLPSSRLVSLAIDGGEGLDVDTNVITAGRSCPLLRELSVYDMSLVSLYLRSKSPSSLSLAFPSPRLSPRLVSLAIDGGEGLDVDTIMIIAGRNCPMLKELSVNDLSMRQLQQWETEEEEEQGRPHTPVTPILATPKP
ncbi:unnamed protein product, partial [Closterium sp. NIES-53]